MQTVIDTDFSYQGITFDERMALRYLFHTDEDNAAVSEQKPAVSLSEGVMQ